MEISTIRTDLTWSAKELANFLADEFLARVIDRAVDKKENVVYAARAEEEYKRLLSEWEKSPRKRYWKKAIDAIKAGKNDSGELWFIESAIIKATDFLDGLVLKPGTTEVKREWRKPTDIFEVSSAAKKERQKNRWEEYKAAREENYNLNIIKDLLEDEKLGQWTYEPLEAPKAFEAEASEEPKAPETQETPEEPKAPEQKPQEPQNEPEESKEPEAQEEFEIPTAQSAYDRYFNSPEAKARAEQSKKEFEELCKKLEERKAAQKAEKAAQKRKEAEERKAAKKALKEAQKEQPAPQPLKPEEPKELEAPKPVEAPKPKEQRAQSSPESLRAEAKKLRAEAAKMLERAESLEKQAAEEEKRQKEIANLKNKIAEVEKIIEEAKANKANWLKALKELEGGDEGSEGTKTDGGFEGPEGTENPESTGFESSEGDKSSGQSAQEAKASKELKPIELINGLYPWEAERVAKEKKAKAKAARLARFEKVRTGEISSQKKLQAKLDKEYAEYCKEQEALFEFEEFANGTNLTDEKFEISEELENLCEAFETDEILNSPELKAPCSLSSAEDKVFEAPKPRAKSSIGFETDETFEAPKLKAIRSAVFVKTVETVSAKEVVNNIKKIKSEIGKNGRKLLEAKASKNQEAENYYYKAFSVSIMALKANQMRLEQLSR